MPETTGVRNILRFTRSPIAYLIAYATSQLTRCKDRPATHRMALEVGEPRKRDRQGLGPPAVATSFHWTLWAQHPSL
jgi:hypothetical protein